MTNKPNRKQQTRKPSEIKHRNASQVTNYCNYSSNILPRVLVNRCSDPTQYTPAIILE